MVYEYVRKTTKAKWSQEIMAIALTKIGEQSIKSVSINYDIPYATLYRHWKSQSSKRKLGRFIPVFTNAQEIELKHYLKHMYTLFFGLTRSDFLKLAFDYAEANQIKHPFKNGKAGEDWLAKFRTRHPDVTLRAPEPTSIARARGFNRPQVERFYTVFWELLEKHKFPVTSIYNMDETGIMSNSNKPPKIFTARGKKQVGIIASSERGQLTTAICCCNAAGSFIPPYFIFARKRMQERLMDGAPPGSQGSCTDNGWVNGPTFLLWLKHFVETVRPSEENKCLLLLDNHESHKFYPALEYACQNNVIFLSFAPHTTNKMQPLDVSVYGPIKKFFEQELNTFQKNHVGRIINQYGMCKLFTPAYLKGATAQNAVSGFSKPGISPYNPNVFGDEDFAPASLTDRFQDIAANRNCNESLDYSSDDDIPLIHYVNKNKVPLNPSLTGSTASQSTTKSLGIPSSSTLSILKSNTALESSPIFVASISYENKDKVPLNPFPLNPPLTASTASQSTTKSLGIPSSLTLSIPKSNTALESSPIFVSSISEKLDILLPNTTPKSSLFFSSSQAITGESFSTPSTSRVHLTKPQQNISPFDVRPVPKMSLTLSNSRKRKSQKSEILTSTPIKQQQLDKFNSKAAKEKKKTVTKSLFTKATDKKKKKQVSDHKIPSEATSSKSGKKYNCLVYGEPFEETEEECIQCSGCQNWAHELCTNYSGLGLISCDFCN